MQGMYTRGRNPQGHLGILAVAVVQDKGQQRNCSEQGTLLIGIIKEGFLEEDMDFEGWVGF